MDKGGQRENGHKQDQYKQLLSHHQWIAHSQSMKDPTTLKLISVIAERDAAIQQRDAALNEKKAALAERDMAMLHRDAAYAERNAALMERDAAMAALQRENGMSWSPGAQRANPRTAGKNMYSDDSYNRSTQTSEAQPMPVLGPVLDLKPRRSKPPQKEKIAMASSRKPRKSRRPASGEDLNQQVSANHEWKDQDLGLNQVAFDDTMMPIPVCSCTGVFQQCYKWGNGGWQSACCTNTISMYPLPALPNKKHTRMSGRKMSGGAFNKLLNKLAAEGHDLSLPVDLKDRWAKHGTNRYITIK